MDHSPRHATSRIRVAALASVAVLLFAACGSSGSTAAPSGAPASASAAPSASPAASAGAGATFTYGSHTQVVTELDPATSYSNEVIAMHNIYETLTRYDAAIEVAQARPRDLLDVERRRHDVDLHAPPGRHLPHRSRDGRRGGQGRDRADACTIGQGAGYIWGVVKSIEAPDAADARLQPQLPGAAGPHRLGELRRPTSTTRRPPAPAPTDDALVAWFKDGKDAGTGPYTISTWKAGDEFELTLDQYDALLGRLGRRATTRRSCSGSCRRSPRPPSCCSPATCPSPIASRPSSSTSLQGDSNLQVVETPSFQNLVALLNTASGPLADPNVREAVAKAFDAERHRGRPRRLRRSGEGRHPAGPHRATATR